MFTVVSCNVNGIRAAQRKGFWSWLEELDADVICLQETKADLVTLSQSEFVLAGYHAYFSSAEKKGYSGVAIYAKQKPQKIEYGLGHATLDTEGRVVLAHFTNVSVMSLYLPSGTSGDVRQDVKMKILDYFAREYLAKQANSDRGIILAGDWNIAHKQIDLKNWRQNQKKSGFLPEERAWMDYVFDELGWIDAFRVLCDQEQQYTWWSYRAGARQNNVGWRIDYQIVNAALSSALLRTRIAPEPIFSDHAPLIMEYSGVL